MDEVEEREGLAAYYLESFRGRIWDPRKWNLRRMFDRELIECIKKTKDHLDFYFL